MELQTRQSVFATNEFVVKVDVHHSVNYRSGEFAIDVLLHPALSLPNQGESANFCIAA